MTRGSPGEPRKNASSVILNKAVRIWYIKWHAAAGFLLIIDFRHVFSSIAMPSFPTYWINCFAGECNDAGHKKGRLLFWCEEMPSLNGMFAFARIESNWTELNWIDLLNVKTYASSNGLSAVPFAEVWWRFLSQCLRWSYNGTYGTYTYSVTEEGCLEIVFALKTFDMYLDRQTFTTQTYQHVSSGWNF